MKNLFENTCCGPGHASNDLPRTLVLLSRAAHDLASWRSLSIARHPGAQGFTGGGQLLRLFDFFQARLGSLPQNPCIRDIVGIRLRRWLGLRLENDVGPTVVRQPCSFLVSCHPFFWLPCIL